MLASLLVLAYEAVWLGTEARSGASRRRRLLPLELLSQRGTGMVQRSFDRSSRLWNQVVTDDMRAINIVTNDRRKQPSTSQILSRLSQTLWYSARYHPLWAIISDTCGTCNDSDKLLLNIVISFVVGARLRVRQHYRTPNESWGLAIPFRYTR